MVESGITPADFLTALLGLLVALSVASERLVEIIKGLILPWLDEEKANPRSEGRRKAFLQILAVAAGLVTALLAWPAVKDLFPSGWANWGTAAAVGFLTSGGSGLWNGVLTYVKNVKDIKKSEARQLREAETK